MQDFSKSESSIQATEYLLSHSSEQKKDYFTLHKQESPTSLTFHEDRCSIIANCWRNKSMRIIVCALLGQFGIVFGIVLFFIGFFSLGPLEALRERQLVRGECLLIEKLWKEDCKDVSKQKRYFPFFIVSNSSLVVHQEHLFSFLFPNRWMFTPQRWKRIGQTLSGTRMIGVRHLLVIQTAPEVNLNMQ